MSYQLTGILRQIDPIIEVSDKFKKREFIIEEENEKDPKYNDFHRFQLVNDKCEKIDSAKVGDQITVDFNLKGRKWEKDGKTSYFSTLDAWKITVVKSANSQQDNAQQTSSPMPTEEGGDLPF